MKKVILALFLGCLVLTSCTDDTEDLNLQNIEKDEIKESDI